MILTERWFGPQDSVSLKHLAQIPSLGGIITALYELVPGEPWPEDRLARLRELIEVQALRFCGVESIPVSEAIKLGLPERDRHIDSYCSSMEAVARVGVKLVCYNFMPVFDWTRTNLAEELPDGSTALSFSQADLDTLESAGGPEGLPGWAARYSAGELRAWMAAYKQMEPENLWENLAFFLSRVIPVAEANGVKMAIHPDDPPWPILGLPRIITDSAALRRVLALAPSPANGLAFCTGSLGANPANDIPEMIREFASQGRIHYAHLRNILIRGPKSFLESAHPSGSLNLAAAVRALVDNGFSGPVRADHGRMIWGEQGRPGYGLFDRALGTMYIAGLRDALTSKAAPRRLGESGAPIQPGPVTASNISGSTFSGLRRNFGFPGPDPM